MLNLTPRLALSYTLGATTTNANVDTSIPEVWAREVLRTHLASGFWGKFVGSAIVQKTELLNKPGDLIHIQVTNPLSGAGIEGDETTLEGNEENLATSEMKVSPLRYRHAVRMFRRANKKSILDLRSEAKMRLAEWGAAKQDAKRFELFTAAALPAPLNAETYTPNDYGPNGHNTKNTIVLADTLTVKALQEIKLKLVNALAAPIGGALDGEPVYALVTHPNATFQLKQESRYESWVRDAHVRGASNPFFRGALAVIDGMVIYEHPRVDRSANGTAIQVATGIAFGREAFVEGLDEGVSSNERDFDYGNQLGISYEFAFQPRRALEISSLRVFASAPTV